MGWHQNDETTDFLSLLYLTLSPLLTLDLYASDNRHIYWLVCNGRYSNQYKHASSNRLVIHHLNESIEHLSRNTPFGSLCRGRTLTTRFKPQHSSANFLFIIFIHFNSPVTMSKIKIMKHMHQCLVIRKYTRSYKPLQKYARVSNKYAQSNNPFLSHLLWFNNSKLYFFQLNSDWQHVFHSLWLYLEKKKITKIPHKQKRRSLKMTDILFLHEDIYGSCEKIKTQL